MKHLRTSQPVNTPESELRQIGYVHSTQGLKGDLFIVLKSADDAWIEEWKDFILTPRTLEDGAKPPKGSLTPKQDTPQSQAFFLSYEIESLRHHKKQGKDGFIIRLYDLDSCNDVEPLVSHTIWIPKEFLEAKDGENIFLAEIEGFIVFDEKLGEIGPIVGFSSNGAQDLIEVEFRGQTFFIPLVKAFIKKLDKRNRKLMMTIPDGLLE